MYTCLQEKFGDRLPVEIQFYLGDKDKTRESVLATLRDQVSPSATASQAKQLLIAMPGGMKVNAFLRKHFEFDEDLAGETAEWLYDLEAGLKWCRDELMAEFAVEAKQLSSNNAAASLQAYFYMDRERWVLDRIAAAAASVGRVDAAENDGIFAVGDVDKILEVANIAAKPYKIALKAYPADVWSLFAAEFPEYDWEVQHRVNIKEFQLVRASCLKLIETDAAEDEEEKKAHAQSAPRVRANDKLFAGYICMRLNDSIYVPTTDGEKRTHYEIFTSRGLWRERHLNDATALMLHVLTGLVKPLRSAWWAAPDSLILPEPLNCTAFGRSLVDPVMAMCQEAQLDLTQLDGEKCRHRLLFKHGIVWDFHTQSARRAKHTDRMGHRTSCEFELWQPARFDTHALVESLQAYFEVEADEQHPDHGKELHETACGKVLQLQLQKLSEQNRILKAVQEFSDDWITTMWLLRQMARSICGESRFTEFMWWYGTGQSGKDVMMSIFMTLLGDGEDNYGLTVNGDFLIKGVNSMSSKEAASPLLAQCRGKRLLWASEVPRHQDLQLDMIKRLCEQQGAKISARKLFRTNFSFRPMLLLVATSNHPPTLRSLDEDDDGFHRRARIYQTTGKFVKQPKRETEKKADLSLAPAITSGSLNPQTFYLLNVFYHTLGLAYAPEITITPVPDAVKELEDELSKNSTFEQLEKHISINFKAVSREAAMSIQEFRNHMCTFFGMKLLELRPLLVRLGINPTGTPNASKQRVVTWSSHKDAGKSQGSRAITDGLAPRDA